jgi:hypothetical protein
MNKGTFGHEEDRPYDNVGSQYLCGIEPVHREPKVPSSRWPAYGLLHRVTGFLGLWEECTGLTATFGDEASRRHSWSCLTRPHSPHGCDHEPTQKSKSTTFGNEAQSTHAISLRWLVISQGNEARHGNDKAFQLQKNWRYIKPHTPSVQV